MFNLVIAAKPAAIATKQKGRLKTATMLTTLALSVLLTACGGQSKQEAAGEQAAEKVLHIATEGAYAPFNDTDASGNLVGFDIDISNALCEKMQVTCEIESQDWEGIIPGLKAKKYDAIVAAMSVTPERSAQVDFTEPYFTNSLVFIATKDSAFDPSQAQMINGRKIAAQRSTISSQWLETTYPDADIQMYDTLNNAFLDLESGRVEAMISDKLPAIEWLSHNNDDFELKGGDIEIDDSFAIAVRKDDPLKQQLNEALAAIKADGTYDILKDKHFAVPQ